MYLINTCYDLDIYIVLYAKPVGLIAYIVPCFIVKEINSNGSDLYLYHTE